MNWTCNHDGPESCEDNEHCEYWEHAPWVCVNRLHGRAGGRQYTGELDTKHGDCPRDVTSPAKGRACPIHRDLRKQALAKLLEPKIEPYLSPFTGQWV